MIRLSATIIFFFVSNVLFAQNNLKGFVRELKKCEAHSENETEEEHSDENETEPLMGVNVYWKGTTIGTTTDGNGWFRLKKPVKNETLYLVVSFVGYQTDTIKIGPGQTEVNVTMKNGKELKEVIITDNSDGSYISKLNPHKTEVISSEGLKRMACCNLSESFENNATVDVGYTDAVSGSKQIQMLGLAGVYSQILNENLPFVRGLASPFGLSYIPGSWMESIQISKGTSSVINGYESVTGQINVEQKKPEKSGPLFINLYASSDGKGEINTLTAKNISDKWSSILLLHGSYFGNKIDHNGDSFIDMPLTSQLNVYNKWNYDNSDNREGQLGIKYLHEDRTGGQKDFNKTNDYMTINKYGFGIKTDNFQVYSKNGFSFSKPETSIGIQSQVQYHIQDSYFGMNTYKGVQASAYVNVIFASYLKTTNHKYNIGSSFVMDDYNEFYNDSNLKRVESVPGAFAQYSYTIPEKLNIIFGIRSDYNSYHGLFITPRFHSKYEIINGLTWRTSAGRGYRSANPFADNPGILATSKKIIFNEKLSVEEAWNYGTNLTYEYDIDDNRKITASADYYRTDFVNQIIMDLESNFSEIRFYNLKGQSYSNSLQAEIMFQPLKRLDITTAFRYNDVMTTINEKLVEKPYISKLKGLISISYATKFDKWKFDLTFQYNGKSRLPDAQTDALTFLKNEYSPEYVILHAQVTKKFKYFETYIGAENLLDFKQHNVIIAASDPFGKYFDTSRVWGPVTGRMFYIGLRYNLEKTESN